MSSSTLKTHTERFVANDETYDKLIDRIGDARFVLIGEASHGTHQFYQVRAELTKALIARAGFVAVAAEADWPDALRANRYVQSGSDGQSADDALKAFERFPTWMWRNTVVLEFITWLRQYNERLPASKSAGFYGMDLYSLHESMREVIEYLDKTDPQAAERARYRYSCFEDVGEDPQAYGYAASFGLTKSCEDDVVKQLIEMQRRAAELISRDGQAAEDEVFYAEQNAKIAVNAEEYYRSMFGSRASSWNLRDTHMVETVAALAEHLERRRNAPAKVVLWSHNSHLGDASATDMGHGGEVNVGQLMRERFPGEACNIGFTTYDGTVTAATNWDEPPQLKRVRPGISGSYEKHFHDALGKDSWLDLHRDIPESALPKELLERAIGVIYRPQTERVSHYFGAELRKQFDIVIHIDRTRALEPLEPGTQWVHNAPEELPETYPFGI